MAASLQDLGPDFWGEKTPPRVLIQRKRHHEGGREGIARGRACPSKGLVAGMANLMRELKRALCGGP